MLSQHSTGGLLVAEARSITLQLNLSGGTQATACYQYAAVVALHVFGRSALQIAVLGKGLRLVKPSSAATARVALEQNTTLVPHFCERDERMGVSACRLRHSRSARHLHMWWQRRTVGQTVRIMAARGSQK